MKQVFFILSAITLVTSCTSRREMSANLNAQWIFISCRTDSTSLYSADTIKLVKETPALNDDCTGHPVMFGKKIHSGWPATIKLTSHDSQFIYNYNFQAGRNLVNNDTFWVKAGSSKKGHWKLTRRNVILLESGDGWTSKFKITTGDYGEYKGKQVVLTKQTDK